MATPETFWTKPQHKAIADMLLKQTALQRQLRRGADFPWHRIVYTRAAELLSSFGVRPDNVGELARESREALLDIWGAGLSWSIRRFGLALEGPEFESLVQAVARRVNQAGAKPKPRENPAAQLAMGVDGLVERAGHGLFSFDHFFAVANALGYDDLFTIHTDFMRRL